jgi:cellulase
MSSASLFIAAAALAAVARAQSVGPSAENHPRLTTWKCTTADGCTPLNTALVIDSLAHPVYQRNNPSINCGDWGNAANATVCPDAETCQENCIMDGIPNYEDYGVFTEGGVLTMKQLRPDGSLASPRVYLLSEGEDTYEMLKLTGQELSFDVDVSKLPCGMNGALYLSEMAEDGGKSELNKGGARYGTGYCDAQCFVTPFINGEPNLKGKGSCCNELDVWEANMPATCIAPHTCGPPGLYQCEGEECEFEGVCDKWGCTYKPYAMGNPSYYGPGANYTVDTTRPFTVVTQFPADEAGVLQEIKRIYVQDGRKIPQAPIKLDNLPAGNSMTQELCDATPEQSRKFNELGGLKGMGEAMTRGMVLALSIWWDEGGNMNWLDSPPCSETEGAPSNIVKIQPDPTVVYSNIKWGDIGSTFSGKPPACKRRTV